MYTLYNAIACEDSAAKVMLKVLQKEIDLKVGLRKLIKSFDTTRRRQMTDRWITLVIILHIVS